MRNKIWTYLKYGNRFCGIEHTSKNDNKSIIVSILKQSKKELNIESTIQIDSIDEIDKEVSKNQHAVLVVNNENVLCKTIESNQKESLKLVHKAFPDLNLEDFYFEIVSEAKSHFISICRKDYVDTQISKYLEKKINIIDISLGNSLISTIKNYLKTDRVQTTNATINIVNEQIINIKKGNLEKTNYDINGLTISNQEILSFSAALLTILKNHSTSTNYKERTNNLLNEYNHSRFFNQFFKFAGLFILTSLLINFFVFNHYFNQVNNLTQVSEINKTTKQNIVNLDVSVSKKQKMVNDLLKSTGSKTSHFTNIFMHSLPESLSLSEFHFQPLKKRIKANKPIELNERVITVSGDSNDSHLFSKWINQLEQIEWIEQIDIIKYGSVSNLVSDFEIKIVLNND